MVQKRSSFAQHLKSMAIFFNSAAKWIIVLYLANFFLNIWTFITLLLLLLASRRLMSTKCPRHVIKSLTAKLLLNHNYIKCHMIKHDNIAKLKVIIQSASHGIIVLWLYYTAIVIVSNLPKSPKTLGDFPFCYSINYFPSKIIRMNMWRNRNKLIGTYSTLRMSNLINTILK